jgi:hypothetical protein
MTAIARETQTQTMMSRRPTLEPRTHNYNYRDTLAASQKIGWRIEDTFSPVFDSITNGVPVTVTAERK